MTPFLAYNLIRALAAEAGALHQVPLERISFKGTVDASRQYSIAITQARSQKKQQELVNQLLASIASDQVPDRPGRCEPRAVKPIFNSLKTWPLDVQRVAKAQNGLGTTFPGSLVLGSCFLPQRRRQGHSGRHERFVGLSQHLTA